MSVRRWAFEDFVLAAVCVAAITLGLWPAEPIRQMIHCHDVHGNTSSYSLQFNDSRLARLRREIDRREHPPVPTAVIVAKWRADLAGHYSRRCEQALQGVVTAQTTVKSASLTSSRAIMPVSYTDPRSADLTSRELAFWQSVASRSEADIAAAEVAIAQQMAAHAPSPVELGEIFTPPKSSNAWIAAILFGLLASCVFAEWRMRAPAIEIVRSGAALATAPTTIAAQTPDAIRIEIPVSWIRIHQPKAVWARRVALALLVAVAGWVVAV